ncbi:MAG TPA: UDP-N-acetylmuramoyl-L-alanine--D-glutamate ligase [Gammaproteobacteria bacterium]|nr:UDP-N-acetylmuramoyl-L-alanine--D-glutamate ligase [Gammaproteobacteria bacterium]
MGHSENLHVIVGLGSSGYSAARYLAKQNVPVAITDSRQNPPNLTEFQTAFPDIPVSLGKLDKTLLAEAAKIVISPGVSLKEPVIANQLSRGTPIVGDVEIFAKVTQAPVIAITGTNAKSTVTTLVGKMAMDANVNVGVGGNLGVPALDLLITPAPELFVLELSSFQLETTYSLAPKIATVLNITPDHMDRYATFQDYCNAKQRVYSQAEIAVCNREDAATVCLTPVKKTFYFTLNEPREREFGLLNKKGEAFLAFENQALMAVRELPSLGRHYQANALASLAIGHAYGLSMNAMLQTLREFKGLAHRCQLVRERDGVRWYNDSKGTNVGATLAAIEGLGPEIKGKLVLIAGGVGKNADFSPLVPAITKYVKSVVLIGEAAKLLANVMGSCVEIHFAKNMKNAVEIAGELAKAEDSVLLSPACASFDMFKNFEHRGEVFAEIVQGL